MKPLKYLSLLLGIFILGVFSYSMVDGLKKNVSLEVGTLYPEDYKQIAPFELTTYPDKPYTLDNFNDKWTLLFFGFTNCPDVCPASLVTFQQIEQKIKDTIPEDKIDYVFISVDPERDTLDKLHAYTTYFNPRFKGVTGTSNEIKKLTRSLAAFYQVPENPDNQNYLVEHSASIYLIGENARPKALFSYPHSATQMANDIIALY